MKLLCVIWFLQILLISVTSTEVRPCYHFQDDNGILCSEITIHTLKRNEFPVNISSTRKLEINDASLNLIEYNALDKLSNLIYLNLNHNLLKNLDRRIFRNTRLIQELYLAFNFLETLDGEIFSNLYYLTYLDLAVNKLKSLNDPKLFASQRNSLIYLKLDQNNMIEINATVLQPLESVSMLFLYNNPINCTCEIQDAIQWTENKELYTYATCETPENYKGKSWTALSDEECWEPWRNIRKNPIKTCKYIERFSLINCKNLLLPNLPLQAYPFNETDVLEIDLEVNEIAKLEANSFDKWPELTRLVLRHNKLKSLDRRLFSMLTDLTYLDISENQLTYLEQDLFISQTKLKTLNLFTNSFTTISFEVFKPLVSLTRMNMLNNPLSCDCLLRPSVMWTVEHNVYAAATCKEPKDVKGQTWTVLEQKNCTNPIGLDDIETVIDFKIIVASVGGFLLLILAVAVTWCCLMKCRNPSRSPTPPLYDDIGNRRAVNSSIYIDLTKSSEYAYPSFKNT